MNNNGKFIEPMIFDDPSKQQQQNPGLIKGMDFDVRDKGFEEKLFIILYVIDDDDLEEYQRHSYALCIGRTHTYADIKEKLLSGVNVDIHRSKIITETKQTETKTGDRKYYLLPYEECISIYSFCTSIEDFYSDDEFNIEDYNNSEVPEKDEIENIPGYLTPEQQDYKKMLEASMTRDRFFSTAKNNNTDGGNI